MAINSPVELERWLKRSPPDQAVERARVVAARIALRVFPLVFGVLDFPNSALGIPPRQGLILQVFRATFISWAARKHLAHEMKDAARAAADGTADAIHSIAADAAADAATDAATYAADAAADAADDAATDAAAHAADAADASAYSAAVRETWAAITADCEWLEKGVAQRLIEEPLWLVDVRGDPKFLANMPRWVRTPFDAFDRSAMGRSGPWRPMLGWYRGILPNTREARPRSRFGEEADIAIARQPDAFWREGDPEEVMADVGRIVQGEKTLFELGRRAARDKTATNDAADSKAKEPILTITGSVDLPKASQSPRKRRGTAGRRTEVSSQEPSPDKSEGVSPRLEPAERGKETEPATQSGDHTPPPETETSFVADAHDPTVDYLNRAPLAFVLAGRLNQIWDTLNSDTDAAGRSRWLRPLHWDDPLRPGFVVHVDAPWGGGKTSFANFLTRILNPYRHAGKLPNWMPELNLGDESYWPPEFRRPWLIVNFNAWRHQHVQPPWWVFSESIRRQCLDAILRETNQQRETLPRPRWPWTYGDGIHRGWRWIEGVCGELFWRLSAPSMRQPMALTVIVFAALYGLLDLGWIKFGGDGPAAADGVGAVASTALTVLFGGGAVLWTVFNALARTPFFRARRRRRQTTRSAPAIRSTGFEGISPAR